MYRYKIGEIINDSNSGKLKILEQIRMGKNNIKGYKYYCSICGNIDSISEYNLINHRGCNVCSGKKILKGYNDINTTNLNLAKLLFDFEDGYKYTEYSTKKVNWKCPICGNIVRNKIIHNINRQGLSCEMCNDNISYPEKFMYNVLLQLNIKFEYQLTKVNFDWCDKYRYDYYIYIYNTIIEVNGLQHYSNKFNFNKNDKALELEQKNDKSKEKLAKENGIENYIVIDCRKSDLDFIKNNILNSKLNELFDLSNIDWLKCHEYACNSLVKQASDLWNNGSISIKDLGKILKLNTTTICTYLKQGQKLGWCDYNTKNQLINSGKINGKNSGKKVICLNNNIIFDSVRNAQEKADISSIWNCCKGKAIYAGRDLITGDFLQWQYYDEWKIKPKKLLSNKEIGKQQIICLNDNKIFSCAYEAMKYYKLKSNHIKKCCENKRNYCGIHPETGKPLRWMYYDDYFNNKK